MLSEDTKLEVLHAHYVDTFGQIRRSLSLRDRLFTYIIIVISAMFLQVVAPQNADAVLGKLLADKLGLSGPFSFIVLVTVLWFALLGFAISYFQTVIYIERQYTYLHTLEDLLNSYYGASAFTREGKSYLTNYPIFSNWTWIIYTVVFPALIELVLGIKLATEFCRASSFGVLLIFDVAIFAAITVSTALYLAAIHLQK